MLIEITFLTGILSVDETRALGYKQYVLGMPDHCIKIYSTRLLYQIRFDNNCRCRYTSFQVSKPRRVTYDAYFHKYYMLLVKIY